MQNSTCSSAACPWIGDFNIHFKGCFRILSETEYSKYINNIFRTESWITLKICFLSTRSLYGDGFTYVSFFVFIFILIFCMFGYELAAHIFLPDTQIWWLNFI